jgi:hypothetical protein
MTESEISDSTASAEEQVWPTVLELQKVLVARLRAAAQGGAAQGGDMAPEAFAISVTSCDHGSCYGR